MQRLFSTILTILACAVLAGCAATAAKSDTYANIKAEMAKATEASKQTTQLDSVASALLPPVKMTLPKARAPLEERFSVSYNNLPAQQFFNAIVAGTRYNMLVSPEVAGTISMNLKDVTLFDVLDAARDVYGYDYRVEGTRIYVQALTLQTRLFHINYLTAVRKSASDIRVSSTSLAATNNNNNQNNSNTNNNNNNNNPSNSNASGTMIESSRISTTSNNEFWLDLKAALEAIVPKQEGRSVVISPQSGVVLIKAMPDELRNVASYLKATQLSVDRQVIIEAKILEVQLNDSFQSGINWSSFASFAGSTANRLSLGIVGPGTTLAPLPSGGGQPATMTSASGLAASAGYTLANTSTNTLFGLAFQTSNFAAMLSFLESQGTVHVMSSPRVAAMNNQPAVFKVGGEEPYVTGVSTVTSTNAAGVGTVSPSVTLQSYFSGVVLDVTPQIDDKGNISLHVHPSVTQISTITKAINLGTAGSLSLPLASSTTSEADTVVRGQDGQIVALGGLMRESSTGDRSQLPGVGDVPILGALFRTTDKTTQKRELVILIKPTIVKEGDASWSDDIFNSNQRMRNFESKETH